MVYRRHDKALTAETTAALNQLARLFWSAATAVVERRLDAEDLAPTQKIERVALVGYVPRNTATPPVSAETAA